MHVWSHLLQFPRKNCIGNFLTWNLYTLWIKRAKYFAWRKTILERGRWCHNSNFIERGNHLIRYWCRKKRPHGSGRDIYTETPALWKGIYTETCVILFKKVLKQSLSFAFKNVFLKKLVFCFLKMHFFQRVPVRMTPKASGDFDIFKFPLRTLIPFLDCKCLCRYEGASGIMFPKVWITI